MSDSNHISTRPTGTKDQGQVVANVPVATTTINENNAIDHVSTWDDVVPTPSSFINYAAATTAPGLNQRPTTAVLKEKEMIARQHGFDLEGKETAKRRKWKKNRMNVRFFAITSWTNASKEKILGNIRSEFDAQEIEYICVAREASRTGRHHLHMQIILKKPVNKFGCFMDSHTGVHCNYQVTKDNFAWNDYITKDGDYVEFGTFPGTRATTNAQHNAGENIEPGSPALPPKKRLTVHAQADERRNQKNQVARQALMLARENVGQVLDLLHDTMPFYYLDRTISVEASLTRHHNRKQGTERQHEDKEFCWPLSFPDCTPQLRDVVTRWIDEEFSNPNRPKCLVLIGPTGTGKTSFALSLPGHACHFKGRWNLGVWNPNARYLVFDDIPWDEFETRNFPNKKDLLSGNGPVSVTDRYQATSTIIVKMPAIVLLNPGDEGSLTEAPMTKKARNNAAYWSHRAIVYTMGPDEFFYKHDQQLAPSSSNINTDSSRPRLGHPNEFAEAQQRWLVAQQRRRQAASITATVTTSVEQVTTSNTGAVDEATPSEI